MKRRPGDSRVAPGWWTLGLLAVIVTIVAATAVSFSGALVTAVPVTVTSERAGLVMETGGKVKFRGVEVGRVAGVTGGRGPASLKLNLQPDAVRYIPANIEVQIRATTVFGAKYVDLVYPGSPVKQRITAGAVLRAGNVTTEVNTVFENLTLVLQQVEPPKLNAVLTALADAFRGKGERIGQATADANEVLAAMNSRMDTLRQDWQSLAGFSDTFSSAAQDIISTLSSFAATSKTITNQKDDLTAALLGTIGLGQSGIDLLGPNMDSFVRGINGLEPTTALLFKYNPEYTCMLQGANWLLTDGGAFEGAGGNGRSAVLDIGIGLAEDPYRYPENLPIVAAKGGPDGKPGCGALPRPDLKLPIRALITNTGYGTGLDWRPNPGPSHPFLANFFPVTKAVPEPARIYGEGPPAIGPVAYPGAPPYGAPLFGPDGAPLWAPPPPGAPPPPVPGLPNPPPPYGTGDGPGGQP